MDIRDCAHECQQGMIPLRSLSSSYPEPTGSSVPLRENSGNGVPPSNTFPPLSNSITPPENHTVPGVPSLMEPRGDSQSGFTEFSSPAGLHPSSYQPQFDSHSLGSTLRPLFHPNPSGPLAPLQSQPALHRPEPHIISNILDESAPHTRPVPAPPSAFPAYPLPPHLPTRPLNTHHDHFPPHYAMPPSFQNQLFQPHFHYVYHPLESNHPSQYYPYSPRQNPPYLWQQPGAELSPTSYQQTQPYPTPMPPFAASSPATHVGPFGKILPYAPRIFGPLPGHFGSPHHFQPAVSQWYYGPGSPTETFAEALPPQAHSHHQTDRGRSGPRRLHRDSSKFRPRSDSERLLSFGLDPGSSSVAVTTPPSATSATATHSLEEMAVQESPKIEIQELNKKSETDISHAYSDRPPVRRSYRPDPPPNRSEWVMWVGNVPSNASHDELWRFLAHPTSVSSDSERSDRVDGSGLISIFLIPRSNCAFVNYRSEEQLSHAVAEFSGRKLRPEDRRCPQLVCRERRKEDDSRAGVGAQRGRGIHIRQIKHMLQKDKEPVVGRPTLFKGRQPGPFTATTPSLASKDEEGSKSDTYPKVATTSSSSYASTNSSFLARHFPKRFFILKSLTQYDLDLSVERGAWATQKHNETTLDQAYRTSKEVILIFSVNKSGEFYGYARMASGILRSEYNISWAPRADPSLPSTSSPSSSSLPVQSSSEQPKRPLSQSPHMYTVPEDKLPENFSSSPAPDPPPTLHPSLGNTPSGKEGPRIVLSSDPESRPTLRPESGKDLGGRAGPRTKGAYGDDGSRLQPVVEEALSENNGEDDTFVGIPRGPRGQEGSWGETFSIEWLSTHRAPFNRTRHLRNPWNHGREIKVSRDGTELEPGVGQRLIDEWPSLASGAGKRGAKPAAIPGPSGESKNVKEEHS